MRNSDSFKQQAAQNEPRIEVEKPLEEIFGPNYKSEVSGRTRTTQWPDTTTPSVPTNFEGGKMKAFYERDPATGQYDLITMFPEP